jgi:hypothetical protein
LAGKSSGAFAFALIFLFLFPSREKEKGSLLANRDGLDFFCGFYLEPVEVFSIKTKKDRSCNFCKCTYFRCKIRLYTALPPVSFRSLFINKLFKMKRRLLLLTTGVFLLSLNSLMAQNPYDRIRSLAQSSPPVIHKAETDVIITANDPRYRIQSRQPIPFKPFELINTAGKPMNPDSLVRLPNGSSITLKNYLDKLNELERQLNLVGYTLRRDSNILLSKMYTDTVLKGADHLAKLANRYLIIQCPKKWKLFLIRPSFQTKWRLLGPGLSPKK